MSHFFKRFLTEDPRRLSPSGRFVGLAAFGKHPGWDDHIEDLGLETESLILAKTILYVNGIGGQLDAGAWEKLDGARQLPQFKHLFVWQRGGQFLIGRMWSSSDGKGRKSYPMVVCAHCVGVPLDVALKQVLPALEELERACLAATTAEEVRTLLGRARSSLREALTSGEPRAQPMALSPEELGKIIERPAAAGNPEAFPRVLYQWQSQMRAFVPGKFNSRGSGVSLRGQQLRVPVAASGAEQAFLFWTRFLQVQVDAAVPLLFVLPRDENWLDVIAGEPESAQFFCLRASPKAVSLVSEVPYTIDHAFHSQANKFLSAWQRGEATAADLPVLNDTVTIAADAAAPRKSGWLRWIGVGVLGLGAAAGVMFFLRTPPTETVRVQGTGVKTNAPPPSLTNSPAPAAAQPVKTAVPSAEDAARLAAEKKNLETMAAAAKLKAEAEAAALKEKERQLAETRRLALEAERAEAARKKAEEEERAKARLAAAAAAEAARKEAAAKAALTSVSTQGETTNSIGMALVPLPSGLRVGKYEVTQAEYQQVMGSNPSNTVGERQPVEKVTWNDAREFCRRLTERERATLPAGAAYTLPTEKQWEEFLGGQKFDELSAVRDRTKPSTIGTSGPANKFGLFDVLGNVWEWTLDGATGEEKLLKGGAYNSSNLVRTMLPDKASVSCGFRCVLVKP